MAKLTGLGMQRVVVVCFVGVETKFHSTKNLLLFNLHLIAVGPRSDHLRLWLSKTWEPCLTPRFLPFSETDVGGEEVDLGPPNSPGEGLSPTSAQGVVSTHIIQYAVLSRNAS